MKGFLRRWGLVLFGFVLIEIPIVMPSLPGLVVNIMSYAGLILVVGLVRRSTFEGIVRLGLIWLLINLGYIASLPRMADDRVPFAICGLAVAVGIVGSFIPHAHRRRAYGILLALLWALTAGAGWDALVAEPQGSMVGVFCAVLTLAAATIVFRKWAATGTFPGQAYIDRELDRGQPEPIRSQAALAETFPSVTPTDATARAKHVDVTR